MTGRKADKETRKTSFPLSVSLSPPHFLTLTGVVLFGFALRLYRLSDANIWWDEGLAIWAARQSPLEIARWTAADVHPPLYFWLLHLWRQVAGDSEFAVRFLSVAVGTLTIAAVWYLGRLLVPKRPWLATTAALLAAVSRFSVWWSQEARMYMLGGLFVTLSLAFTVRLRRHVEWRAVAGYLVTTIAALWTLYLLAFVLIIEGIYWLWSLRDRDEAIWRPLVQWAGLQIVVLASFAPWLAYALPRMRSWSAQEAFEPALFVQLYATLLTLGVSTGIDSYWVPTLVIAGIILVGLIAFHRGRSTANAARGTSEETESPLTVLLLTLLIPPVIVWLVTMLPRSFGYTPHPEARYLLPFAPPFYLLVTLAFAGIAAAIGTQKGRCWTMAGVVVMVVGVSLWSLNDYYDGRYLEDDYKSIALTLRAHKHPDDLVVLHTDNPWPIFAYHWPGEFEGTPHLQDADPGGADHFLSPLWQAYDALWLVINEDALRVDPQRHFERWLSERATAQHEWRFGQKRLILYSKTPARAARLLDLAPNFTPPQPPSTMTGPNMALVGWDQPLDRVRAGTTAHLAAYVSRENRGGSVTVTLGNTPVATDVAALPAGNGIVRVPLHVQIPSDTPERELYWHLALRSSGRKIETTQSSVAIVPDTMPRIASQDVVPEHRLRATFGEPTRIELLGYDVQEPADDGEALHLTLYWQARTTLPLSYKVFAHLINAEGRVETQRDSVPANGTRPTTSWRSGEVIVDTYEIPLAEVPAGPYTLRAGFYDPATGERLGPVRDAAGSEQPHDQITLTQINIE